MYHIWFVREIKKSTKLTSDTVETGPSVFLQLLLQRFLRANCVCSKTAWLLYFFFFFFCPRCSTKPNIDKEQFSGDNVPICSVPILSAVAHKSSVHLRPNCFHSRLFYGTCRNFEGEGAAITEFWESERGRGAVLEAE